MKAFKLLIACVLFSTAVFANETVEPKESSSSVAVTNPNGNSVFKVYYKGEEAGVVKVSILDGSGNAVFYESIKSSKSGFMRPYNLNKLSTGVYSVVIEDKQGKRTEEIKYSPKKIEKYVNFVKLNNEGKYILSVKSLTKDNSTIRIYNEFNELIHSQYKTVLDFAEVINLKSINQFTIEVSDSQGLVKSIKN